MSGEGKKTLEREGTLLEGSFSLQTSLIFLTFLSLISFTVHTKLCCTMRSRVRQTVCGNEIRLRKVFVRWRGGNFIERSAIAHVWWAVAGLFLWEALWKDFIWTACGGFVGNDPCVVPQGENSAQGLASISLPPHPSPAVTPSPPKGREGCLLLCEHSKSILKWC